MIRTVCEQLSFCHEIPSYYFMMAPGLRMGEGQGDGGGEKESYEITD
jgi:hypothetical protein